MPVREYALSSVKSGSIGFIEMLCSVLWRIGSDDCVVGAGCFVSVTKHIEVR